MILLLSSEIPLGAPRLTPAGRSFFLKLHDAACKENFFEKIAKKLKKRLAFPVPLCYNNQALSDTECRDGAKKNMGAFPSGQWGQTVNLLLNASVVRIHQLPPKRTRNLGCGFFFVLELVGFEQVGRPQTAKNSPADCFLDRGLRIHQLPPKSCGKDVAAAFFFAVSHKIGKGSDRFSKCVL